MSGCDFVDFQMIDCCIAVTFLQIDFESDFNLIFPFLFFSFNLFLLFIKLKHKIHLLIHNLIHKLIIFNSIGIIIIFKCIIHFVDTLWLTKIKSFDARLWEHSNSLTTVLVETSSSFDFTRCYCFIDTTLTPLAPRSYTYCCVFRIDCIGRRTSQYLHHILAIHYTPHTIYTVPYGNFQFGCVG